MGRHYKGYSFDWSIYKMYDEQGDAIVNLFSGDIKFASQLKSKHNLHNIFGYFCKSLCIK